MDEKDAKLIAKTSDSNEDLWNMRNLGGDILAMVLHFVVWNLVILLLELDFWKNFNGFSICKLPAKRDDLNIDSDVEEEEKRVVQRGTQPIQMDEEND